MGGTHNQTLASENISSIYFYRCIDQRLHFPYCRDNQRGISFERVRCALPLRVIRKQKHTFFVFHSACWKTEAARADFRLQTAVKYFSLLLSVGLTFSFVAMCRYTPLLASLRNLLRPHYFPWFAIYFSRSSSYFFLTINTRV